MNTEISIDILTEDRMAEMIAFHHLCFPNDAWKDEDWEDLLSDPRCSTAIGSSATCLSTTGRARPITSRS